MQSIDNASKPDDASILDNAPHNSDLEVNIIIREIEMEILLQVSRALEKNKRAMCTVTRERGGHMRHY